MADYISQFTGSEIDQRLTKVPQLESGKQDALVSGENIKTVGGQSLLGSGNITVGDENAVKFIPQTLTAAQKAQALANIGAASLEEVANMDFVTVTSLPTASASTMGHMYLVGPDANNNYDRYVTKKEGSTYSWTALGSTQIDLSTYATKDEVSQLEAKVDEINGGQEIPVTASGKYVALSGGVGTSVPSPTTSGAWTYYKKTVSPGDLIVVNGFGGTSPRLWGFADSNNIILSVCDAGVTGNNLKLIAPENAAYIIINDNSGATSYYSKRGSFTEKIEGVKFDVSNLEKDTIRRELKKESGYYQLSGVGTTPAFVSNSSYCHYISDIEEGNFVIVNSFIDVSRIYGFCGNDGKIIEQCSFSGSVGATEFLLIAPPGAKTVIINTYDKSYINPPIVIAENSLAAEIDSMRDELYGVTDIASIHISPGDSTSAAYPFFFSRKLKSGHTYKFDVTIENGAIDSGIFYLKDANGTLTSFELNGVSVNYANFEDGSSLNIKIGASDVVAISFSLTDANIHADGRIIITANDNNEKGEIENMGDSISRIETQIVSIEERIGEIAGATPSIGTGASLVKPIINSAHPYYFSQGWGAGDSFGYLEDILKEVPEGKHFLLFSDIHIDYSSSFSLSQPQAMVMRYVHDRLQNCKVLFGGDVIGTQATEIGAKKVLRWFTDEYYGIFGGDFVPALGDHDTDYVSGGLPMGSQLTEEYLYETYFKPGFDLGNIKQDTIGIDAIDNVTFSEDESINESKKSAYKSFMRMHYYMDDDYNKIRFIVVQQGATFRQISSGINLASLSFPFVAKSVKDAPDDYDIVILSHEFHLPYSTKVVSINNWENELGKMLNAFKSGGVYSLSTPYMLTTEQAAVWSAITADYPDTYSFAGKTGVSFLVQGDEHFDYAGYFNPDTETNYNADGHLVTEKDILHIIIDRAVVHTGGSFPTGQFPDTENVLQALRRAPEQGLGNANEVLFDIVTINEDGVTLNRVGDYPVAGRTGLYPVFDETADYGVGDIVIWYEISGGAIFVYAYRFISAHSPGTWDISEVEQINVTIPYKRSYPL